MCTAACRCWICAIVKSAVGSPQVSPAKQRCAGVHIRQTLASKGLGLMRISVTRRYQLSWAGPQFGAFTPQQHIDYANTTQVQRMGSYIAKGGLPAIVGEWALAGPSPPDSSL